LGGVLIAILTFTPESFSAFRAALEDKLQHSVNVFLGSAVATIGLTFPCVVVIGLVTNQTVVLGLKDSDMLLLLLTLFVSALTFGGVRTNMLQGAVHLLIFYLYLLLIVAP
jgi:Ca2+:H+ antiporter